MISPELEKQAIIPELSSVLFNSENYNYDNNILRDKDKMRKYAVGYCCGEKLSIKPRKDQMAVMYDVYDEEEFPDYIDNGKYWCHLGDIAFIDAFIPSYFDEQ